MDSKRKMGCFLKEIGTIIILIILIIAGIALGLLFRLGVNSSPQAVIKEYYYHLNRGEYREMNELRLHPKNYLGEPLDTLEEARVIGHRRSRVDEDRNKNKGYYDSTVIRVETYLLYEEGSEEEWMNGEHVSYFWMVKEKKDSQWKIEHH